MLFSFAKTTKTLLVLSLMTLLGACATPGARLVESSDPYEGANRKVYAFNDALDRFMLKPVAKGYKYVTPGLVRTGITNFFDNWGYVNVVLNSFLQGKFDQGAQDTARFVFNTSIGLGGLIDVATPMKLPKHNEDLGQTLAVWGVRQGAFLNLPLLGPNTARNTGNFATGALTSPWTYASMVALPLTAFKAINARANLLDESELLEEVALDPYAFTREAYLQRRAHLIYDGELPPSRESEVMDEVDEIESLLRIE